MDNSLVNLHDYEKQAKSILSKDIFEYYAGGSLDENTLKKNISDLSKLCLFSRVLKDVSYCDTGTNILGLDLSMPVMGAPMAFQRLVHSHGETAMAQALHEAGLATIVSTMASQTLESIRDESKCQAWFQLYIFRDREITMDLLARAKSSGYQGIVLTVDAPVMGKRERDIRNQLHLPQHVTPKNFDYLNEILCTKSQSSAFKTFVETQFDRTLTWKDIDWLKSKTSLPIILKGITHPEDALTAVNSGVEAVIISNHGGRQLDGTLSSIELLRKVPNPIKQRIPFLMDGGIRRGADILKALLLGARCVLVGRPLLWGLAVNGKSGVSDVISILRQELIETMMLTGVTALRTIDGNENILC